MRKLSVTTRNPRLGAPLAIMLGKDATGRVECDWARGFTGAGTVPGQPPPPPRDSGAGGDSLCARPRPMV